MPVDPCFAALLSDPRNAVRPPPAHVSAQRFRNAADAGLRAASKAPVGAASDRVRVADHAVPGPGGPLPIRLYRPYAGSELPLIVFLHGGGFVFGGLETHDTFCRALAGESGAAVVAVDYRLAPEARFPAAVEDAYAALAWAAEHGREHGVDTRRIALCGDSAGGNLAVATALLARERGPTLLHLALLYPAVDPGCASRSQETFAEDYLMTRDALRWFWSSYLGSSDDAHHALAAPLEADLSGLPAATVITAEFDPLRDEGEALAGALSRVGVPVKLRRYAGMVHGFASFSDLTPLAEAAVNEIADGIRVSFARSAVPD